MNLFFVLMALALLVGCTDGSRQNAVGFVGGVESDDVPSYYSQYHIDGWLTDYECVASLPSVNDVLVLGDLIRGYKGNGFLTLDEAGISGNENVKYLPNGIYTSVISETDWVELKTYVESKI